MNAVVDALTCFDLDRRQIEVLSLGCGETVQRVDAKLAAAGLWGWRGVIKAAIRAQSKNALGQTFLLLGKDHVICVDAPESRRAIALDDYQRARSELPELALAHLRRISRSLYFLRHGSILSRVGASGKPGAVHHSPNSLFDAFETSPYKLQAACQV